MPLNATELGRDALSGRGSLYLNRLRIGMVAMHDPRVSELRTNRGCREPRPCRRAPRQSKEADHSPRRLARLQVLSGFHFPIEDVRS
jgi:hypothetical protein